MIARIIIVDFGHEAQSDWRFTDPRVEGCARAGEGIHHALRGAGLHPAPLAQQRPRYPGRNLLAGITSPTPLRKFRPSPLSRACQLSLPQSSFNSHVKPCPRRSTSYMHTFRASDGLEETLDGGGGPDATSPLPAPISSASLTWRLAVFAASAAAHRERRRGQRRR